MLQDDAVRNLQFDSEIRVAQQNHTEPRGWFEVKKEKK